MVQKQDRKEGYYDSRRQPEHSVFCSDAILDSVLTITAQSHLNQGWKISFSGVLFDLCRAFEVNRFYIVERQGDYIESTNFPVNFQYSPCSYGWIFDNKRWLNSLNSNKFIHDLCSNFSEKEQKALIEQQIQSILIIPIFYKKELWGIIGMDCLQSNESFTLQQIKTLQFIANILTLTIGNQKVRSERDRLTTVVEQSSDCTIVTSVTGQIVYANKACGAVTGYRPLEIVGQNIKYLYTGPVRETLWKKVREALAGGTRWSGQLTNYKKDHSIYEEELQITPVHDQDGMVINQVIVKRDITEEKRLESLAEAANLMDNIGFIFSSIRHELGNPINSIKVSLSVLDSNLERYDKTDIKRFIDRCISDIGRVEYLLKTLKNFSIFERPRIKKINIAALLDSFTELVKSDLTRKGVRLITYTSSDSIYGMLDPRAFQQVLLNLITNAVDALADTRQKGISLSMFKKGNGQLNLILSDNGCGIRKEDLANLFRPFFTTKPNGTGLGLVIVKKMLAKMNCSIEIHSQKEAGTQIVIIIPEA